MVDSCERWVDALFSAWDFCYLTLVPVAGRFPLLHSLLIQPIMPAGLGYPLADRMSFLPPFAKTALGPPHPQPAWDPKPNLSVNNCFSQPFYWPLADPLVTMAPPGAWGLYVGTEARQLGLAPAIGLLFDDNGHARTLDANRDMNTTKQNQRITNRTQQAQSIKSDHCYTFNAFYRVGQSRINGACPISVYAPRHMLLFVRMLGDPRQTKNTIF